MAQTPPLPTSNARPATVRRQTVRPVAGSILVSSCRVGDRLQIAPKPARSCTHWPPASSPSGTRNRTSPPSMSRATSSVFQPIPSSSGDCSSVHTDPYAATVAIGIAGEPIGYHSTGPLAGRSERSVIPEMTGATAATTTASTSAHSPRDSAALRRARGTTTSGAGADTAMSAAASDRSVRRFTSDTGRLLSIGSLGSFDDVRAEDVSHRGEAARHQRTDRRGTTTEQVGDDALRLVLVVAEHDRRSLLRWERGERSHHRLSIGHGRFRARDLRRRPVPVQVPPLECPTPEMVLRQVHDRAPQVRVEGPGRSEMGEPP